MEAADTAVVDLTARLKELTAERRELWGRNDMTERSVEETRNAARSAGARSPSPVQIEPPPDPWASTEAVRSQIHSELTALATERKAVERTRAELEAARERARTLRIVLVVLALVVVAIVVALLAGAI